MDSVDKETRSRIMRSVKSKRTKLEKNFFAALKSEEIEDIEWNPPDIFGKPDFANRKVKVAVFLDSCFWHGCNKHFRLPNSNIEYWQEKIVKNRKRDKFVTKTLLKEGWIVIRIWEHSLSKPSNINSWAKKVSNMIREKMGMHLEKSET